ncbi:urate oxidase [Luteolibacter pohnpeiensis]|uniref:Uricase n=1 Tax=Luteolibacter pohnpeiensis TaxID=454153 RepID=A0A934S707_9BACT|nr:urate oxidase [Luteolibacter pohnpeiensis]MBK1880887.1 urate oxidase [Luteolibacter pohnpeiensis]
MPALKQNQYGKSRVRFLRVHRRDHSHHDVSELEADVLLSGDLEGSYLSDDNSSIVPTDTVKNTLHFLAHENPDLCRGEFALVIGHHFLAKYPHLHQVKIELRERAWSRMEIADRLHPHAFTHDANGTPFTKALLVRGGETTLSSGIRDHLILKTTASGFTGYHVCDMTTLPPTTDRILSTKVTAEWTFSDLDANFQEADAAALKAIHRIFATTYSPSVQRTLYEMGEAILHDVESVATVQLALPNVHFLNIDLGKFGRPGQNVVFLPTDEPHGQIEATMVRDGFAG